MIRTPRRTRRYLVEQAFNIDVRRLKSTGQVAPGEAALTLYSGGKATKVCLVHLERPVFGGVRTYFCCPACDRRCDLLYAHPHIACRRCHSLAFASENESRLNRTLRQMHKQRNRLGQSDGGVVAPFPSKPKWWRWPRYLRTRRTAMEREHCHWQMLHEAMAKGRYA